MKRILSIFLITCILTACNDSKKETTTESTTTTTETKTEAKKEESKSEEKKTTTAIKLDVPKFEDGEVQQFADEYAAFVNGAGKLKTEKPEEYGNKTSEFIEKQTALAVKVAKNPAEQEKFNDFLSKADEVLAALFTE